MGCSSSEEIVPTTSSASSVLIAGAISSIGCSTEKLSRAGALVFTASTRVCGSTPWPLRPGSTFQACASSSKTTCASTGVVMSSGTRPFANSATAASSTSTTGSTLCSPDQVEEMTAGRESSRSSAAAAVAAESTLTPRSASGTSSC